MPTALRTAELDLLPLEIRERSFFMAGVEEAEILDAFLGKVEAIVAGEKSESEAMAELHDYLKARGYQPLPGQEGTIKDLRSIDRMQVALRTNVEAARSYGQWARQQEALAAFPATRYTRAREAMVPRDWPARWRAAIAEEGAAGATDGASEADMVALANHPLWTNSNFNRFGSPWPPFDFMSGMMCVPVPRAEAEALGLLPAKGDESPEAIHLRDMLEPRDRSFNETLEARPAVASQALRDALADRLQGFAEWDEDTLRFTDPNGTRPGTIEAIADIVTRPLPIDPATGRPFPSLQAAAVDELLENPEAFLRPDRRTRGRDRRADFARLAVRSLSGVPVSRALRRLTDADAVDGVVAALTRASDWRIALEASTRAARVAAVLRALRTILT